MVDGANLTIGDAVAVARHGARVGLADAARARIATAAKFVESLLERDRPVMRHHRFGKFADVVISAADGAELQRNLLLCVRRG